MPTVYAPRACHKKKRRVTGKGTGSNAKEESQMKQLKAYAKGRKNTTSIERVERGIFPFVAAGFSRGLAPNNWDDSVLFYLHSTPGSPCNSR